MKGTYLPGNRTVVLKDVPIPKPGKIAGPEPCGQVHDVIASLKIIKYYKP